MTMEEMEKEINLLHDALTNRGVNSRRTADIFGREVRARTLDPNPVSRGASARFPRLRPTGGARGRCHAQRASHPIL